MKSTPLKTYIQSLIPLPDNRLEQVVENFELLKIPKNELILKEGQVSEATYFLEEGYMRSYVNDRKGQEVTTNIFSAPSMFNDFLSFFKKEPTDENFQALTDCKLWFMTYENAQNSFHSIPEFREFGRMMLVTNYSHLHKRTLGMIRDTAEKRYLNLVEEHPDIFQNVSLKIIASYLGITDSSLSRIRREISKT